MLKANAIRELVKFKDNPLLSVVIVGRNDDYMDGYHYCIKTVLDLLARNLGKLSRIPQVEVVFVDWNSKN